MQYMIHASPARMWYVEEFLLPSMLAQGIQPAEVEIRNDTEGLGNLFACMESFRDCGSRPGGTWHLQDDVVLAPDFAERTAKHDSGVVSGFGHTSWGPSMQERGKVPVCFLWYSFQCQRIPNEIAGACAEWFFRTAQHDPGYRQMVADRKHDDQFFRDFLFKHYPDLWITNLDPCLVDHIDYLIGGTLVNRLRKEKITRAAFWPYESTVTELQKQLLLRNQPGKPV